MTLLILTPLVFPGSIFKTNQSWNVNFITEQFGNLFELLPRPSLLSPQEFRIGLYIRVQTFVLFASLNFQNHVRVRHSSAVRHLSNSIQVDHLKVRCHRARKNVLPLRHSVSQLRHISSHKMWDNELYAPISDISHNIWQYHIWQYLPISDNILPFFTYSSLHSHFLR